MRALLLASVLLSLTACGGAANQKLIIDAEAMALTRNEVINGIEDCKTVDLRPVIIHARKKVNGRFVPVVIDVTCAPKSGG